MPAKIEHVRETPAPARRQAGGMADLLEQTDMDNVMPERWLPVPGWGDFYEVSDWGHAKSLSRIDSLGRLRKGRILKTSKQNGGYESVTLSAHGIKRKMAIHRLVLLAFVGPCPPGMEARHLDGNPANGRLDNLAWGTRSENTLDQIRHGTHFNASKTQCSKGHEYTPDNIFYRGTARQCKACDLAGTYAYAAAHQEELRQYRRDYYQRRKAEGKA